MTRTTKTKTKEKTDSPEFIITVTINDSVYQGTGATALEALQSVPAPTNDLITTGSVRIEHGDKSKEMLFPSMQLKRLLNPYNMEVLVNDLQEGL